MGSGDDFRGDHVRAFARFSDDVELGVEGDAGLHERAGHGGVGDGSAGAAAVVERVGWSAGDLDEAEGAHFGSIRVDADDRNRP